VDEEESEYKSRAPNNKQRRFIGQEVKAEQLQKAPDVIMKQSLSRNDNMKPGRLIRMTDNVTLQIPEVPARFVKKGISVPWRRAEIPEVRDYKKQDPKEKECCFWVCQRLETASQLPRACCKSSKQT